jgi:hypothetical protein
MMKTDAKYAAMTLPTVGTCVVSDDEAVMDVAYFDALLEYSSSLPTGTFVGKRWKRRVPYVVTPGVTPVWYLCEFVEHLDPELVGIVSRRITQVTP